MKKLKSKKETFLKNLSGVGFVFDDKPECYRVKDKSSPFYGQIGVKAGHFKHSCFIETSDIYVLFFGGTGHSDKCGLFWDMWVEKV